MISTDKYDMFIQPLTEEHADKYKRARRDAENPHIIYRRSTDRQSENFCALDVGKNPCHYRTWRSLASSLSCLCHVCEQDIVYIYSSKQ